LAALPLLAGCGSDSPSGPGGSSIATDHTEPAALFAAWAETLEQRDLVAYEALLEDDADGRAATGFRYQPPAADAAHWPWMLGRSTWGRDEELAMIGNLLDPNRVNPETNETVDIILVDLGIVDTQEGGLPGETVVTVDFEATVLWAAETGATADVRLVTTLAEDEDGYLRIRLLEEVPQLAPAQDVGGVTSTTWARIKVLHRDPTPIPTDHTQPRDLIGAWMWALETRDLAAYTALLEPAPPGRAEPGFRYYPPESDLADFPWMQGSDHWDGAVELEIVGHLFDPDYVSPETGESVDSINALLVLREENLVGPGEIEMVTIFEVILLWAPDAGAAATSRLVHVLAEDSQGFLRIREQRESRIAGPRSVEDASWAALKNLYR